MSTEETNPIFPKGARLIVWTSKTCGPCQAMKKKKVPEGLAAYYVLPLQYIDVETPLGEELSDRFEIHALPTVQVVIGDDGESSRPVLAEFEGSGNLKECIQVILESFEDKKTSAEFEE